MAEVRIDVNRSGAVGGRVGIPIFHVALFVPHHVHLMVGNPRVRQGLEYITVIEVPL